MVEQRTPGIISSPENESAFPITVIFKWEEIDPWAVSVVFSSDNGYFSNRWVFALDILKEGLSCGSENPAGLHDVKTFIYLGDYYIVLYPDGVKETLVRISDLYAIQNFVNATREVEVDIEADVWKHIDLAS